MKNAMAKVKQAWEENPLAVIAVGSTVIFAVAKLMDANTNRQNAQSWKTEVNRRNRKSAK